MGKKTEIERFNQKFIIDPMTNCWNWIAGKNKKGYGKFSFTSGQLAHRFSYQYFIGPIPQDYEINHKCRTKSCVNPEHLEALTSEEHHNKDKDLTIAACKKFSKKLGKARRRNCLPEGVFFGVKRKGQSRTIYSKIYVSPNKTVYLGARTPATDENINELSFLYQSAYRYLHGSGPSFGCFPPDLL